MIEANRMPVPEADKKLKLRTAFSATDFGTTGGTRNTSLSRPQIGIFGAVIPSRNPLVCGKPQTKTTMLRIIHGCQALNISDLEFKSMSEARASARASSEVVLPDGWASDTVRDSSPASTRSLPLPVLTSKRQMRFGCQNRRNVVRAAIETIAATTSTNHGPWKLDTRNCGIAKHAPATRMAGQISSMPRKPANAHISQKGTISEKNGN